MVDHGRAKRAALHEAANQRARVCGSQPGSSAGGESRTVVGERQRRSGAAGGFIMMDGGGVSEGAYRASRAASVKERGQQKRGRPSLRGGGDGEQSWSARLHRAGAVVPSGRRDQSEVARRPQAGNSTTPRARSVLGLLDACGRRCEGAGQ